MITTQDEALRVIDTEIRQKLQATWQNVTLGEARIDEEVTFFDHKAWSFYIDGLPMSADGRKHWLVDTGETVDTTINQDEDTIEKAYAKLQTVNQSQFILSGVPNILDEHKIFVMHSSSESARIGIDDEPAIDVRIGDKLGSLDWKVAKIFELESATPDSPPGTGSGQKVLEVVKIYPTAPSNGELQADRSVDPFVAPAVTIAVTPENALVVLNSYFSSQGSDVSSSTLEVWDVSPYKDALVFSPKGVRSNNLYIVKGSTVSNFSPAIKTLEEMYGQIAPVQQKAEALLRKSDPQYEGAFGVAEIPEVGYRVWQTVRGGGSLIFGNDGGLLFFNSSVTPDEAVQAYKDGKRTPEENFVS